MRMVLVGTLIAISSAAAAQPGYSDRFVDAKSGYVVESRTVGSWLRLRGRHPDSGATFKLKVSGGGRVTGDWDGRRVDYRLSGDARRTQLAAAADHPSGAR